MRSAKRSLEEQEFRRLRRGFVERARHKFPSMLEYKSPTTLDMPEVFTELVEHPIRASLRREGSGARSPCCR